MESAVSNEVDELFEHAPASVHTMDLTGRVLRHNGWLARTLGYSTDEVGWMHVSDFVHPKFRARDDALLDQFVRTGNISGEVLRLARRDGSTVWARLWANARRDAGGRMAGARCVVAPIDDHEQRRHELGDLAFRLVSAAQGQLLPARAEPSRIEPVSAMAVADLSERASEVLGLLAQGSSNAEIAAALHLSESTIQYHVSQILRRLGLRNRTEAAAFAVRRALE